MTTGRINQVATFFLPASAPKARLNQRGKLIPSGSPDHTSAQKHYSQGEEREPQSTEKIAQGQRVHPVAIPKEVTGKSMVKTDNMKATPHRKSQNNQPSRLA